MLFILIPLCFIGVLGADFTLPGICPNVTSQEEFDYNRPQFLNYYCESIYANTNRRVDFSESPQNGKVKVLVTGLPFSGVWHHVGGYASDGRPIHDCSTLDLQKDDQGYTLKETYVEGDERERTKKWYHAKVDTKFYTEFNTQFTVLHKFSDNVVKFPFMILSTDYENYAIAYLCVWVKEKERNHYVYTWILTRRKENVQGDTLKKVEDTLSKYTELDEHRQAFIFKEFNEVTCSFSKTFETDFFTSNFG